MFKRSDRGAGFDGSIVEPWAGRFLENRTVQHPNFYLAKWATLVHSPLTAQHWWPTPFFWENGL